MMTKTNKGGLHLKFTSNAAVGAPPAAPADNGPSPGPENVRAVGGGRGDGTAGAETPDDDALDADSASRRRALATDEAAIVKSMLSKGCSSLCEESLRSRVLPHHSLSSRNAMIKEKDIAIRSNDQEMMHNLFFQHFATFLQHPPPLTFLQPPCKFP